jgi:hypothetical protein
MQPSIAGGRRIGPALLGLALAAALPSRAQAPAPPPGAAQASAVDTRAVARELLARMANFLSQAPRFSVNLATDYDSVQESGEKIEFGERRNVVLSRPDKLRVDTERSDGRRSVTYFTGKDIMLVGSTDKVYATEPQQGAIDDTIVHFISDLGLRLPLAVLLMSTMPAEFDRRVREIDYVEKTNLLGPPSHHLAARTDSIDFQLWVADGPQPVPLRVVINYRKDPGQPEFRASFNNWNFAPAITDATFVPLVPVGAQRIAFAAELAVDVSGAARRAKEKGKRQ